MTDRWKVGVFGLALMATSSWAAQPGMNIVFILADDLGWADTTLYGHTRLYETPNLQRLALRGMTFHRAYSASPLCSPTRSSILTGRNPARTLGEDSHPDGSGPICIPAESVDPGCRFDGSRSLPSRGARRPEGSAPG